MRELIKLAKEQDYLTYDDIHEILPKDLVDPADVAAILDRLRNMEFNINMNAWMLSQFLHGEQGALLATAKLVQQVPWEEAKFYAANQVSDEARHVEVYHRYLTEKMGVSYPIVPSLQVLEDLAPILDSGEMAR